MATATAQSDQANAVLEAQRQLDAINTTISNIQTRLADRNNTPEMRAEVQAGLDSALAVRQGLQSRINNAFSADPDPRPFNDTPGGPDSRPPNPDGGISNEYRPGMPEHDRMPQPGMEEMAKLDGPIAQQFTNTSVGQDTTNIVDPNYIPGNDFAETPSVPAQSSSGGLQDGIWDSLEYATDWNAHHGKFKFLFKVQFGGGPWQYYVKSATKPKVKMIHQDVNYYNFRTKVLTQVAFDPMTIVLWDEIGNTVNKFFASYVSTVSGQGSGNWGVDQSFDPTNPSSSSKSYRNAGAGDPVLATVIIEQIFANGTKSNRFIFKNARIEAMDLDDLTMDATEMNTLSITFNYESLECKTVERSVIHTDPGASMDLLRGGGSAGSAFGANDDGRQFDPLSIGGAFSAQFSSNGGFDIAGTIFSNAIPNISTSFNANNSGVSVNLSGLIPGLGMGGVTVGPNGVTGGLGFSVPGFGANLQVGPGGVSGGIGGGLPGVGGQLVFGPNGIAGNFAGGIPGMSGGVAFNPNGVSAGINAAISSQYRTMTAIEPPIGSTVSESSYMNRLANYDTSPNHNIEVPVYIGPA